MIANYSLLQYSFNPKQHSYDEIVDRLHQLKFFKRMESTDRRVSMWIQGLCILMVVQDKELAKPGITALGLTASADVFETLQTDHDDLLGMTYTRDTTGKKLLLVNESADNFVPKKLAFDVFEEPGTPNAGITGVSGIVNGVFTAQMMDFYQSLGFKFSACGDQYNVLTSDNNRFTMLVEKFGKENEFKTLICDTHDIWHTISAYTLSGVEFAPNEIPENLDFGNLNHKIIGYNCLAVGSKSSYSIEKLVPDALPGMDMIIRMRKQYLTIKEDTLKRHYVETNKIN